MNLSTLDLKQIGDLPKNYGYRLLCDLITADLDDQLATIETGGMTDEQERRALAEWRAGRRILARLINVPKTYEAAVDEFDGNDKRAIEVLDDQDQNPSGYNENEPFDLSTFLTPPGSWSSL
jgi:hypothetical protein